MNQKIAIFIPNANYGGAQKVIINLIEEFSKQDIFIDLLFGKAEGIYLNQIPKNVNIVDLDSSRLIKTLPKLVNYLKKQKPDVLMSTPAVANVVATIAKQLSGVSTKLILREAIHYSTEKANVSFSKQPTFWIALRLVPLVYPWADKIIAVNPKVAKDIAKVTNISLDKIDSINNPTITPLLLEKAKDPIKETWFQQIDRDKNYIILGIGRLVNQKDFSTLIRAFAIIRTQYQAKLIILGEGENRNQLENLISDLNLKTDVLLPGFISNPYTYMAKASVFVLSSAWEGSPNTLVEAMACGTPVVSTDCLSGPREILENGKYGRLVKVGNYEALAEAIIQTLISDNDIDALKERAKDFSVENIAQEYLQTLLKN